MELQNMQLLDKYPAQVPRYTSYPTAPHFTAVSPDTHKEWLAQVTVSEPISLYVHIPYCKKLCSFCGCNTQITQQYKPVAGYIELLESEIALVSGIFGAKQTVSHVHFGGGSPTILEGDDFSTLMDSIQAHFALLPEAEVAIEIDPRTTSEAKIASYARHGINRVSIGVQDFDPAVQAAINRIQPFSCVYRAISLFREYNIGNISLDLVYGLPKQTLGSFLETLEQALLLAPNRIALFGYAHVPWKKKNMRLIDEHDLPNEKMRYAMFAQASRQLVKAGYIPVGLDHFVKPDDAMAQALATKSLRRNFQGYTTDKNDILVGLGASSISSFPQGYIQNAASVADYKQAIAKGYLGSVRGYSLSDDDRLRRSIIEQLMCYYAVDLAEACNAYGADIAIFNPVLAQLRRMEEDSLLAIDGYMISVGKELPQAVRLVCAAFDVYFSPIGNLHAKVA